MLPVKYFILFVLRLICCLVIYQVLHPMGPPGVVLLIYSKTRKHKMWCNEIDHCPRCDSDLMMSTGNIVMIIKPDSCN